MQRRHRVPFLPFDEYLAISQKCAALSRFLGGERSFLSAAIKEAHRRNLL